MRWRLSRSLDPRRFFRRPRTLLIVSSILATLLGGASCAARQPPATPATLAVTPVQQLRLEIERLLAAPGLERSVWALKIQSLDRGDTLYEANARKLMMPASNMKIVTVAAAAERLGWDHRFETTLLATGPVVDGTLQGDLVVRGTGDPSIGRGAEGATPFEDWANRLASSGLRRIAGRIVGDDDAFEDEGLGAGWAWDYLAYGYAAPSGALEYNDDTIDLVVRPGASRGEPVDAALRSEGSGLSLVNAATTGAEGEAETLALRRMPGSSVLRLEGTLPRGSAEQVLPVSVDNPTAYFVQSLRSVLIGRGIQVDGEALDVDTLPSPLDLSNAQSLLIHRSPPLSELAKVVMKVSQNMYADTFLKAMGRSNAGSVKEGRKVVAEVLKEWGIDPDSYVMYDGSGLSRYNYVTADMLVQILRRMHESSTHAAAFRATLPIGGEDGSLARRYQGSPAARKVWAKTGSISNVRALSGFVETVGHENLVFSILANHFTVPQSEIDAVTDAIVEALARFTRN